MMRRCRQPDQAGMTMLEILLVLGLMALLMVVGSYTVNAVSKSALRAGTIEIAAALKSARNLAAQSGMHHRVLLNLDQQTYQLEVCPDPIQLHRGAEEEEKPDQEELKRLAEQPNPMSGKPGMQAGLGAALGEVSAAESPEQALKAAAALAGVRVGTARCGLAPASGGDIANFKDPQVPNVHQISSGDGIAIRRIHVQHLKDPVAKGEVSIHFFPLGQSEKAMIELVDRDGDQFNVLLHGLTGRVEVRDGEIDPDQHMRRDAAGDEVDEP
jgi:type II secretory pathway pseudopilin PulG